jgi:hypothetical protein
VVPILIADSLTDGRHVQRLLRTVLESQRHPAAVSESARDSARVDASHQQAIDLSDSTVQARKVVGSAQPLCVVTEILTSTAGPPFIQIRSFPEKNGSLLTQPFPRRLGQVNHGNHILRSEMEAPQ